MKNIFFVAVVFAIPLAIVGWLLYLYGRFFWSLVTDWQFKKELAEIREHAKAKREQRQASNQARLDNGCEHDFSRGLGGLPPGTCRKCGLEEQRPPGPCDHVWRAGEGGVPNSSCEKCGKRYSVLEQTK